MNINIEKLGLRRDSKVAICIHDEKHILDMYSFIQKLNRINIRPVVIALEYSVGYKLRELKESPALFTLECLEDYIGNGFSFKRYSSKELLVAITRALETYKYKHVWKELVLRGMKSSFSWELPAQRYIKLYKKAINFKYEQDKMD